MSSPLSSAERRHSSGLINNLASSLVARLRRLALVEAILCFLVLPGLGAGARADTTVTILHVNDSHSHLLPYGPKDAHGDGTLGGLARVATVIERARAKDPGALFLHGGDLFVGDFMFQEYMGAPELQILKALGADALVLGNHEFDLYSSTLKGVLAGAGFPDQGFPILSANLDTSADAEFSQFVQPYVIKQVAGVKVGILGLTTDYTNQGSNPAPIVVQPPIDVAQAWVDELRNGQGCNLVVVLSHLGVDMDQVLASSVSGIDVIVGGHSHTLLAEPIAVGNTLIVQAGEFYGHVGRLQLRVHHGTVRRWSYKLIDVDSSIPPDRAVQATIDDLRTGIEADPRFGPVYTQVVGQAAVDLAKPMGSGLCRDNPLGNLAADALREVTGTDIALQPQGFMSQTIWAGPITGADVFQAFPYGFDQDTGLGLKVATFRTTGQSLLAGLEFALYNLPYMDDFFLHAAGLSMVCNTSRDPGQRVVYSEVRINGQPIDPAASYTVTAPDGVVPFLGQIPGFTIDDLNISDHFLYQVMRDYLCAHSPAVAHAEGRVLDLTSLSPPVEGAGALSDVVALFRTNGWINPPRIANQLTAILLQLQGHLRAGRVLAANADLERFQSAIADARRGRHLAAIAAERLSYLAGVLAGEIPPPREHIAQASPESPQPAPAEALTLAVSGPCRDRARIQYRLPGESDVSVMVMDVLGRLVRTLVNEREGEGERAILWDGRSDCGTRVPSGKYFVMLQAGAGRRVASLLLIK
jgi:5'-nucleotidase / UDP-sugar diphosphatase